MLRSIFVANIHPQYTHDNLIPLQNDEQILYHRTALMIYNIECRNHVCLNFKDKVILVYIYATDLIDAMKLYIRLPK